MCRACYEWLGNCPERCGHSADTDNTDNYWPISQSLLLTCPSSLSRYSQFTGLPPHNYHANIYMILKVSSQISQKGFKGVSRDKFLAVAMPLNNNDLKVQKQEGASKIRNWKSNILCSFWFNQKIHHRNDNVKVHQNPNQSSGCKVIP